MQATYENFGCNEGNVFIIAIDHWHNDNGVIQFDETYGIQFPSASGNQGGGNEVFDLYGISGTPTVVVIAPDREILIKQLYPPSTQNLTDSLIEHGGILMECSNGIAESAIFNQFRIYPNPANSELNIEFNISDKNNLTFEISDILGQQVYTSIEKIYPQGTAYLNVNVSNFQKGLYILNIYSDGKYINSEKIIIDN